MVESDDLKWKKISYINGICLNLKTQFKSDVWNILEVIINETSII